MKLKPVMTTRLALFTILFALLSLSALAGHKRVNSPNPDDKMQVQIYELDNGLRVYLTENHEKPRFYAEIAVRAGSKNDPAETTGLAHYLEHLLFKGNRNFGTLDYEKEKPHLDRITELYEKHFKEDDPAKRAKLYEQINAEAQKAAQYAIPGELDGAYQAMGSQGLNAHTSTEETVYKINLPSNRLRQWARIESDRFIHPVFRLFHTELETVYEEKNRSLDNKNRLIFESVDRALFKNHPYGQQSTIGEVEHLKKPSIVNIRNFYNTHYIPNNMAIFISGDIDIKETIAIIDENFSRWEKKPLPEKKTWKEEKLTEREQVTVPFEGEEFVILAFRVPDRNHRDAEVLQLIDMILSNAVAGLIDLNLNQKQLVRQAGSYLRLQNDYGSQYLYGIPKKGQPLEEVERLLLEQLKLVVEGKFEDWIIPAIINNFKKDKKASLESNEGRVSRMREAFISHQDWDYSVEEIQRFEKIRRKRIIRVAKRYYTGHHVAGYRIDKQHEIPTIEKPKIDKIEIDSSRQSKFMKKVLAMPVKEIEPVFVDPKTDFQILEGPKGVRTYYSKNPLNDLFTLSFRIDMGSRQNNKIQIAAMLLDKSGTERYSPEDLKKEWYKLGSDFNVGVGQNETFITISGLDENLGASLALAKELLEKPKADPATLDTLKKIILGKREDAKKDPKAISSALVEYNRYGKDSSYLQLLPAAQVKELTVKELQDSISDLLNYEHTIQYVGSLPPEKVLQSLAKHLPVAGKLKPTPPYKHLKARKVSENEIYFFNKEMAQSQVQIEFGGEIYNEKNNPPSQIFNAYFGGGMGAIVFQELREARGLAYSAYARYVQGSRKDDQDLMAGVIGTQVDKTTDALDAFLDLFDNLPESEERFQKAVQSLLNRYRTSKIGFREVLGAVRAWERLGLPIDPRRARYEAIQKADMETLLNFHRTHIKNQPKIISITGDQTKIDPERLKKSGKIINIELNQIFVD